MALSYDRTADMVRKVYDRRISGAPVLDLAQDFPGGVAFVKSWGLIRDEALVIVRRGEEIPRFHEIMPEQASISANDGRDWRMFILKAYGIEQKKNMAECPVLASLVRQAPEVLSASLSILGPGKHIPPHRGPMRGIMRFYMALCMPYQADGLPAAVLKVAGVEHRMREGQFLLWDDTFEHEAWNRSDASRIVLLLDVWRPRMPLDMQVLSAALIRIVRLGIRIRGVDIR